MKESVKIVNEDYNTEKDEAERAEYFLTKETKKSNYNNWMFLFYFCIASGFLVSYFFTDQKLLLFIAGLASWSIALQYDTKQRIEELL